MMLVKTIKTKKFVPARTEGFYIFAVAVLTSLSCCPRAFLIATSILYLLLGMPLEKLKPGRKQQINNPFET